TGIWTVGNNMNHVRTFHTATELENGDVLVAGGSEGDKSAELYVSPKKTLATINKINNLSNGYKVPVTKKVLNKDGHNNTIGNSKYS
ncbi:unnamed protein product, partial [Adineta ricciae]